jgi:hypothetical protein
MVFRRAIVWITALAATAAWAQSLEIYSEFQRVDPFGNILPMDRALRPREILSPAVARNAFASFHIVVSVPPKESYFLYVLPNPVNACRVALYKEHFVKTSKGWIPDALVELHRLPDFGVMPDPEENIPGQTTRLYLLDLWIPPDVSVSGFRLEVQLKVGYFLVRPMEVRIIAARVPDIASAAAGVTGNLPGIDQSADASALGPLRSYISGATTLMDTRPLTVRGIIRRNAIQDMALAGLLESKRTRAVMEKRLSDLYGNNYLQSPRIPGAEWYLRIRDFLYAQAAASR